MTVIHANDPTTKVLSHLYEQRQDISARITEASTNGDIQRALRGDITDRHVQFLRNKTCIGIWCHANLFAEQYGLHGLFSGMIISELQEAIDYHIPATKEEIDAEMEKFARRLNDCIERFGLAETPVRMRDLDDVKSELTLFNYNNLYYYE